MEIFIKVYSIVYIVVVIGAMLLSLREPKISLTAPKVIKPKCITNRPFGKKAIYKQTMCKWCGGRFDKTFCGWERKTHSYDVNERTDVVLDYHEDCWVEAQEVTI